MTLTTDPNHPDLKVVRENGQQAAYLVLSKEERDKGFTRPVRTSYIHVGPPQPQYDLRALTEEEKSKYVHMNYVAYEEYPDGSSVVGRYWTQAQLNRRGCGYSTVMSTELAETYARDPNFYGATYCSVCRAHYPVGIYGEFVWVGTQEKVGT